jgi:hypothetical protein
VIRNNVKVHYGKVGTGYLFDTEFQNAYFERDTVCYVDFLDEQPSSSHIKEDAHALYGALLSACQGGVGQWILMESKNKKDSILT